MNLSEQSLESTFSMLAFREYLIENALSPPPEVPPHLKVAPATPPTDDEDSWGDWKGLGEPPVKRRRQSPDVPGEDYPNGRPPGMPPMMPPPPDTPVGKNAKGRGKGDKGKPVGKNAKDKAKDRGRSREEKRNGKGKMSEAKTRVLQATEKRLMQQIAEARADLDRRQSENELEESKKRKREVRFEKQDEKRPKSLPEQMPTEVQSESNFARYARKRALDFTGDIPPS